MEESEKNRILDMLLVSKIGQKALNKVSTYNPNLIANLSKQAYDLYMIRKNICEEIFPVVTTPKITLSKVKEYIQNMINESNILLEKAESVEDKELLSLRVEELKDLIK
jgi:Glu-tRNA(Gln) amidotransferase subunit E-like FAD-binding protein